MTARERWVLVVEDDDAIAALLQFHVREHGYRCERAADGAAALQAVIMARTPPLLVLLDLGLRYMDGEALGLEIRRLLGKEVPIAIVSGRPHEQLAGVARRMGASHLAKPFETTDLERLLTESLGSPLPQGRPPQRIAIRARPTSELVAP